MLTVTFHPQETAYKGGSEMSEAIYTGPFLGTVANVLVSTKKRSNK